MYIAVHSVCLLPLSSSTAITTGILSHSAPEGGSKYISFAELVPENITAAHQYTLYTFFLHLCH